MPMQSNTIRKNANPVRRLVVCAGLACALAATEAVCTPSEAFAASPSTTSELTQLQSKLDKAASDFQSASARADEINKQIDEMSQEILDFEQTKLPAQQKKTAQAARNLYKMQNSSSDLIAKLLTSGDFSDMITLGKYATTIQDNNTEELNNLKRVNAELKAKMNELSRAKDEADAQQQKASEALGSAQSAADKIQQKANSEDAAEAQAAADAQAKATSLTEQAKANGTPQPSNSGSDAHKQNNQGGSNSNRPSNNGGNANKPANKPTNNNGTWLSGHCSAYGGATDPGTGNTTATGAAVTEDSMGVAMPLNLAPKYYGRRVQLSYGGKKVVAVVNDCGGFGSTGRIFDLQPGIWRAFGFSSCNAWGDRVVQYRWL